MIRLSASSLARAERCPASASLPAVESISAASERGRMLHAGEAIANPEGAEVAYALDVETGRARELGRNLDREYPATTENEIVGTTDRVTVEAERVVVRDYKSGQSWVTAPRDNLQLGFYAVAAAAVHEKRAARVELDFLDKDSVIGADLDAFDLIAIRARIHEVWRRARQPEPKIVTGDHCAGCPCIARCPPHLTMAIAFTEGMWPDVLPTTGLTVEIAQKTREYLANAKRVIGLVERTVIAFASQWPIPADNGKVFGPHEVEREQIHGGVARKVLAELYGQAIAEAATEMDVTKASIERAVASIAPNRKKASMLREALAAISAAGGVIVNRKCVVEEYLPKENDNGVG